MIGDQLVTTATRGVWLPTDVRQVFNVHKKSYLAPPCVHFLIFKSGSKMAHFALKWTTASHHGVGNASLNTHLQSFHSPIAVEEERPSLEMPNLRAGDRPELELENGHFWTLNRP